MRPDRFGAMALIFAGGFAFVWTTWPSDEIALDRECRPATMQDRISAAIHGDSFWEAQRQALRDGIDDRLGESARLQSLTGEAERTGLERRLDHLSEPDPATRQAQERQRQIRRIQAIAWLTQCESVVSRRLSSSPEPVKP